MRTQKILFPVGGRLQPADIARSSFWLARYLPAELYLVEVTEPPGLITRLLARWGKRHRRQRLEAVQQRAMWHEAFYCEIRELPAAPGAAGIAEIARQIKPQIIMLTPELQEQLGAAELRDLKRFLGQSADPCSLILLTRGLALAFEPCGHPARKSAQAHPPKEERW